MSAISKPSKRLGNRKTKTGCITCKARRIKCGEEKPACLRCISTGRKCDGYETDDRILAWATESPSTASPGQDRPLAVSSFNQEQHQVFSFFVDIAASQLAGCTSDDFWTRLVPQYSHLEPAVRHAILAIGSLLLQSTDTSAQRDLSGLQLTSGFPLKQYNKAIKSTLASLSSGKRNGELATLTCILFVCIEALQGHETEAITLFNRAHGTLCRDSEVMDQMCNAGIHTDIVAAFSRLTILCTMFDSNHVQEDRMDQTAFYESIPALSTKMNSLDQGYRELLELLRLVQSIAVTGAKFKWSQTNLGTNPNALALCSRQAELELVLETWHERFTKFTKQSQHQLNQTKEKIALSTLTSQYHIIRVWLDSSLQRTETSLDAYMYRFVTIVSEASTAITLMKSNNTLTPFTFEMGFIPTLYWTVTKCRHPIIRRQALSLLEQSSTKEGLWDKRIMTKVARRVIQLEENLEEELGENIRESCTDMSDAESTLATKPYPDESMRIQIVQIHLKTKVDGREGDYVEFLKLPRGISGGWDVQKEFVTL